MHGIGNADDAEFILHWVRETHDGQYLSSRVENKEAPEGWKYVGRGSFRSVWLSPDGVAYKVEHRLGDYQSSTEVRNLERAWKEGAPEGCRLPRFDGFRLGSETVVAQELVVGKLLDDIYETDREGYDRFWVVARACSDRFMLTDLHGENVIIEESTNLLVPVDFGY